MSDLNQPKCAHRSGCKSQPVCKMAGYCLDTAPPAPAPAPDAVCEHDEIDVDTAFADGLCPLCLHATVEQQARALADLKGEIYRWAHEKIDMRVRAEHADDLAERLRDATAPEYIDGKPTASYSERLMLEAAAELVRLRAERDAAVADAERYRWMERFDHFAQVDAMLDSVEYTTLKAAVDTAREWERARAQGRTMTAPDDLRDRVLALASATEFSGSGSDDESASALAIAAYKMAIEDAARACVEVSDGATFMMNKRAEQAADDCAAAVNALAEGL